MASVNLLRTFIRNVLLETSNVTYLEYPKSISYDGKLRDWPTADTAWKRQVPYDGPFNAFVLGKKLIAFAYGIDQAYSFDGIEWKPFDVDKARKLYRVANPPKSKYSNMIAYYDLQEKDKKRLSFKDVERLYPEAATAAIENESMVRVGEEKMSSTDVLARRVVEKTWKFWTNKGTLYVDFPEDDDIIGVWNVESRSWKF